MMLFGECVEEATRHQTPPSELLDDVRQASESLSETVSREQRRSAPDTNYHPPSRPQHTIHFTQGRPRVWEMRQSKERHHDVEGAVIETQRFGIRSTERNSLSEALVCRSGDCNTQHAV